MPDALISYPFTEEGLRGALQALGTTADAVARNLDAMGYKGCVGDENECPVANYLLDCLEGAGRVWVMEGLVHASRSYIEHGMDVEQRLKVDMPDPVEVFVERFDAQRFPGLIAQPEASDGSS